jgi:methyl-accepting chemotaxis protein
MLETVEGGPNGSLHFPGAGQVAGEGPAREEVEAELARYVSHLGKMSSQLRQTSAQIESSIVEVCGSFQGIAERAKATVARASGFLGDSHAAAAGRSFEGLIQSCETTLVKIMNTTVEAGEVSRRAIERVRQMDKGSQQISAALGQLEEIAKSNKMLALNARIEASHAGARGAGFAVVAVELASQTAKSRAVTAQLAGLAASLRALAESTVEDLQRMNERDRERVDQCRREVDESLGELQAAHDEMKRMLGAMSEDGALLASDIGSAVRGLQFQDRISQRLAHVIEDLETIQARLVTRFGHMSPSSVAADEGFSAYTMREEREVAGSQESEASAGDVELF